MTTLTILLQTASFLLAMGVMTGHALRLSRRNLHLTRRLNGALTELTAQRHAVNEWREQSRMLRRRAERSERVLETVEAQLEEVSRDRDAVVVELGGVRADLANAIEARDTAREIGLGLLEERDNYAAELDLLRDDGDEPEQEMAN